VSTDGIGTERYGAADRLPAALPVEACGETLHPCTAGERGLGAHPFSASRRVRRRRLLL